MSTEDVLDRNHWASLVWQVLGAAAITYWLGWLIPTTQFEQLLMSYVQWLLFRSFLPERRVVTIKHKDAPDVRQNHPVSER